MADNNVHVQNTAGLFRRLIVLRKAHREAATPRGAVFAAAAALVVAACVGTDGLDAWPAQLVARSPISQTGLMGYAVNDPPVVQLLAADGKPIPGVEVTFTIASGGGRLTGGVATTGSDGLATAGGWSIAPGANTLIASINRLFRVEPVPFTASGVEAAYQINVVFVRPTTPARQAVFTGAAARWQQVVYGDVPDVPVNVPGGFCYADQPAVTQTIDDLLIHVILDSIDGPGAILGRAGPCLVRPDDVLPYFGLMIFDTADVAMLEAAGQFDEVILHEMGHVLGFGTIWSALHLLVGPTWEGGSDPYFTGSMARAAFDRVGATAYTGAKVPVENIGGPGTRDAHWRESVLGNELMTGFLNVGIGNPLSVVTVASLGDEAYRVNYAAADAYSRDAAAAPAQGAPAVPGALTLSLGDDVLHLPIYAVDRNGRVTHVYRP